MFCLPCKAERFLLKPMSLLHVRVTNRVASFLCLDAVFVKCNVLKIYVNMLC